MVDDKSHDSMIAAARNSDRIRFAAFLLATALVFTWIETELMTPRERHWQHFPEFFASTLLGPFSGWRQYPNETHFGASILGIVAIVVFARYFRRPTLQRLVAAIIAFLVWIAFAIHILSRGGT